MLNQNATLSREFIEQQRERLEALQEHLLDDEGRRAARAQAFQEAYGNEPRDLGDEGANMAQNEIHQALDDIDERQVRNIRRALQKIEEGTYGLSDLSDKPIPKARLEVSPEAIYTIEEERREESK